MAGDSFETEPVLLFPKHSLVGSGYKARLLLGLSLSGIATDFLHVAD